MPKTETLIPSETIAQKIFIIRGHKVMLDFNLALLYGVETKQLKRQVTRNIERFPDDFMFQLNKEELESLRCQFGTSSWGGRRYSPYVFTEQGVAMLSSVLNSKRAIEVNIAIMRTFTRLREMMMYYVEIKRKIEKMEKSYNEQFKQIFDIIKRMLIREEKPKPPMGFCLPEEEREYEKKHRACKKQPQ